MKSFPSHITESGIAVTNYPNGRTHGTGVPCGDFGESRCDDDMSEQKVAPPPGGATESAFTRRGWVTLTR